MPSLVTYNRAKDLVPALGSLPQTQVDAYLDAASEAIEEACGRGFAQAIVTEENARTDQYGRAWLWRNPVDPTYAMTVTDNAGVPVSFMLENSLGELIVPGMGTDGVVKVTYRGGFALIPPSVELAVSNLARRRIEAEGDTSRIAMKVVGSTTISYKSSMNAAEIEADILRPIAKYIRKKIL